MELLKSLVLDREKVRTLATHAVFLELKKKKKYIGNGAPTREVLIWSVIIISIPFGEKEIFFIVMRDKIWT